MIKMILTILIIGTFFEVTLSQTVTQTIRGNVFDKTTHEPLIGANIIIVNTNNFKKIIACVADVEGKFLLNKVPVGRQTIKISMVGYKPYIANEIMVSSGKQVILNIGLQKTSLKLNEVVVQVRKDIPLNTMATLSSRQFTVEETQRYAGGLDDPARLASSFAGVAHPSVSSNGISIRGNNPSGLLWRIEGVEVPSPNHFANLTIAGAGLLTALSSQMMGNSEFYTGAFPAEFGNATSGVFDIKLKSGNNEKREYTLQAGLIGIDFSTEGPFIKGKDASYLLNYRYSTMALLSPLLPDDAGVLKYQDFSFKINLPTKKIGTFSFWGLAALDGQNNTALDSSNWKSYSDRDNSQTSLYLFASGLSHKLILNSNTFLSTSISTSGSGLKHKEQRLDYNLSPHPQSKANNNMWRFTIQSSINHRFGKSHLNQTGFYISSLGYNIDIAQSISDGKLPVSIANKKGNAKLLQFYTQSKIKLHPKLTLNVGLHSQYFMLNKDYTIEPRVTLKYQLNPKHSFALAYGLHSRLETLSTYFISVGGESNKNLKLMKSFHYVLSYNAMLSKNLRLSIEPYYQHLTNVPVSPNSYVSTINNVNNLFFNNVLVSVGTAENIGIDFTLEHFLSKGFYYLLTGSIFDSKFKSVDGIERNTHFNKNYVFNALIGKEWQVGEKKNNLLSINLRLNYLGGNRKAPINKQSSIRKQEIVYGETNGALAFSEKMSDLPIVSFTVSYRINSANYSSVISLQVLNATGTKEFNSDYFNIKTNSIDTKYTGVLIPNLSYKIEF